MLSSGADGSAPHDRALSLLDGVRWCGELVSGERIHALLGALAGAPPEGMSEGRLIEAVWGDDVPVNPTKALQVVVSRARSATAPDVVVRTPRGYRLGPVDTDVALLDRYRQWVLRAEASGDWTAVVAAAEPAVAMAVADVDEGALGRLREEALRTQAWARTALGRALSTLGRHSEAVPLLEDAGDDEATLAALLRSEAALRGAPAALQRYEAVRRRLADELGVDPGPALRAVHAELLARDRPVREGVLYDASRLVGREADVAAISAMVRTSRVTSIIGPGGLGKTRLAHLMGRLADQPVVHFVELAGVTSPEGVAMEVADVLGLRDSVRSRVPPAARRSDLASRILDQVGSAPALLILDNCEHLVGTVAALVQLLVTRTPALRVLTTSRAPLGIAAERVYRLPQLGVDDAVELFVERASAARPGARLETGEVRSLVERLDGLPLAIELAAAKVRLMSVAEIGRRLENRFSLLRGGSRDAPERHQTLLAVIDWSWNLLVDEERTALRRLSVFRDGFSLTAAEAVVGADVLGALHSLVDQSLVTVLESQEDLRYRLLETVREFGQVQLVDAGDDGGTTRRLVAWGTAFCERAENDLFGPRQIEVMGEIRREEGNLVHLLRWCLQTRDADAVTVLMACLSDFWTVEGSHLKVAGLAHDVEDVVADAPVAVERLPLLRTVLVSIVLNSMIFLETPTDRALRRIEELGAGADDTRSAALTRVLLAVRRGMLEGDGAALELLCADDDARVRQLALLWSSLFQENRGELALARQLALRSRDLAAELGARDGPWPLALISAQLAGLALQTGATEEALAYADEALPVMEALGATEDVAQLKAVSAVVAMQEGRLADVAQTFDEIEEAETGAGVFGAALIVLCGRPELDLAAGRVEAGLAGYRHAVRVLQTRPVPVIGQSAGFEPWVLYPQAAAVSAHVRHGRPEGAAAIRADLRARAPLSLADGQGFIDFPVVGAVLFALAQWELVSGPAGAAAERAVRLLALADRFGYNRQLPSLSWAPAEALAESVLPGALGPVRADLQGRPAHALRDEARRLVEELD